MDHSGEGATLLEGGVQVTSHVEGRFGVFVTSASEEGAEAIDSALEVDEHTWVTSEDLGHVEWLGEETFDLTGTSDGQLILFGEIVHTENGDDILEGSVVLDQLLDATGAVVMDLTDDGWVEHTRGGVKRIDGRVDTEGGNNMLYLPLDKIIQQGSSGGTLRSSGTSEQMVDRIANEVIEKLQRNSDRVQPERRR
jgi:hypothetical protein